MVRISTCIVDKSRTKTCLGLVLDIAQSFTSQNSRMYKLQEIESIFYEARPIEGLGLINQEMQKNIFCRFFKHAQAHENI